MKASDKGGWSYIIIDKKYANQLKPGVRTSFRVKGALDNHRIQKTSLLPLRNGGFMLPINAMIRKATGKKSGDRLRVTLEVDERKIALSADLLECLKDDPQACDFFHSLSGSNQRYCSKWIEDAKTPATKTKRLVACLTALGKRMNYAEMMQYYKTSAD
jgi:Domain of unknown function (DUF1905)/Bacteriocin-protection, YdeI or OmpD-Associated